MAGSEPSTNWQNAWPSKTSTPVMRSRRLLAGDSRQI
jgi:hypothetical protein